MCTLFALGALSMNRTLARTRAKQRVRQEKMKRKNNIFTLSFVLFYVALLMDFVFVVCFCNKFRVKMAVFTDYSEKETSFFAFRFLFCVVV